MLFTNWRKAYYETLETKEKQQNSEENEMARISRSGWRFI